jgi:DNA-3-methyladenine glycosylase
VGKLGEQLGEGRHLKIIQCYRPNGLSRFRPLPRSFYRRPAEAVARDLLGRYLVHETGGERLVLRLVETEAYLGEPDRASHAFGGRRTPRNESLYLPGGHAYVYFIYGMHWCLNAVTGEAGVGSAVLLRAGEPVQGGERMRELRGWTRPPRPGDLAGGPGKLCQALGVDRSLDGVLLDAPPLWIAKGEPAMEEEVVAGPRIGVDYAGEAAAWPLRFALRGNPHVSRPRGLTPFPPLPSPSRPTGRGGT